MNRWSSEGMRTARFSAGVVAMLAVGTSAGCGSGGGGGFTPAEVVRIPLASFGGLVVMEVDDSEAALVAYFASAAASTTSAMEFVIGPTDACVIAPDFDAGYPFTLTYLDVGAEVRASRGAAVLQAPRETIEPPWSYLGFGAGAGFANGATFEIEVDGAGAVPAGSIGSISMPFETSFVDAGEGPFVTAGEPLPLAFFRTGSTFVTIDLYNDTTGAHWTCSVQDDGEFTVPADVTTAVGSAANVSIGNASLSTATVAGRQVVLVGLP